MSERPRRATIVGAGGLGGPIAFALAAARVELTIVDPDVVELSNLHRQLQFTAAEVGTAKASVLAAALGARGGRARGVIGRWSATTADELGGAADVVIDASDDPATKFAVADWAVGAGRRYVIAAALRYGGNAMVGAPGAGCYRCLFEEPAEVASCADAGVLGPIVGAIGGVAAALALQLLGGDDRAAGSIWVFDDVRRDDAPRIVRFAPRVGCSSCARAVHAPVRDAARASHGSHG